LATICRISISGECNSHYVSLRTVWLFNLCVGFRRFKQFERHIAESRQGNPSRFERGRYSMERRGTKRSGKPTIASHQVSNGAFQIALIFRVHRSCLENLRWVQTVKERVVKTRQLRVAVWSGTGIWEADLASKPEKSDFRSGDSKINQITRSGRANFRIWSAA
jgi:hypothetical protein